MNSLQLTNRARIATTLPMQGKQSGPDRSTWRAKAALGVLAGGAVALGGCVSVNAPDKPIVIELNINIKQEVIYRLAADAGNTIDENKDIF
ncbi:YnbE family lipoprotein [Novosphingobium sp.]|uniref:YnbE family lipoprotein n=1 Tax=Novosphingobium sp. TaxID=1874826 RepID=UPI0025EA1210|nr:YnbE family lipoprotein [Novosphingobium sp.]